MRAGLRKRIASNEAIRVFFELDSVGAIAQVKTKLFDFESTHLYALDPALARSFSD